MEGLVKVINAEFWKGKRVFVTGNTGFKGAWLSIWLAELGAEVFGYALEPPTNPSIFAMSNLTERGIKTTIGNINNEELLRSSVQECNPEIVFHLAAQPIVRTSYEDPITTYLDNVVGTARVLDSLRGLSNLRAVVCITTDKCYENKEWEWGYRESDTLGGYDPYSASKACSEIVCASYRQSFFSPAEYGKSHSVALATARAGNVIGGGDWAKDRLIPDILKAFQEGKNVVIRNPHSIRPWQHVLEPLHGYLTLAEHVYEFGPAYGEAWNFGPEDADAKPVSWIVNEFSKLWNNAPGSDLDQSKQPHEAGYLKLDCSKAKHRLAWNSVWDLATALKMIYEWDREMMQEKSVYELCAHQIKDYMHCMV